MTHGLRVDVRRIDESTGEPRAPPSVACFDEGFHLIEFNGVSSAIVVANPLSDVLGGRQRCLV